MAAGMLGGRFSPDYFNKMRDQEDEDARRLERESAMGGFQADRYASRMGADLAGKGLGAAAALAAGKDPRTPMQRDLAAVEAAKAEVAKLGIDPDKPETIDQFYRQVIQILQKQGLAAEALEVGKEYADQKLKRTKSGLEVEELQRKKDRDAAVDARAKERNALLLKKFGAAASPMGKMLADYERADDPFKKQQLLAAIQNLAGAGWKAVDLGDRVELRDAKTGAVLGSEKKGAIPETGTAAGRRDDAKKTAEGAYGEYMAGLQRQYNAAAELYNHPGLEGITGRLGRKVGEEGFAGEAMTLVSSDDARAALALYKQVTGGAFLAGLAKLKAASKTGATGLGAVSEREGDKVQSDAAALDRAQEAPDLRRQLATYVQEMEGFAKRMAAAASGDQIAPVALAPVQLTGPVKRGKKPTPAARPATPSKPSGQWSDEKERRYQELKQKLGT